MEERVLTASLAALLIGLHEYLMIKMELNHVF